VLIWAFVFVICLQALKVSDKRFVNQRDKKGKVSSMRRIAVSSGGRSAASSLRPTLLWLGKSAKRGSG
jgi:hypothetical protein